jgi:hypothetical protein
MLFMVLLGRACPTCGRTLPETPEDKLERLTRRANPDDCWLWTGHLTASGGYGQIDYYVGRTKHTVRAHRLAYERAYGPIPEGLLVRHRCASRYPPGDVSYRRCCNPAHLELGTDLDNHRDMWSAGRQQSYDHQARGEGHPGAKLTTARVLEMRRRFKAGETSVVLAEAYGVGQAVAWKAIHGLTWAHVPEAQPHPGRGRGRRRAG